MVETAPSKETAGRQDVQNILGMATYNADSIVSRTLINTKSGTLTFFAFAKGQKLSEHTCPFDAFIQVVEGTAEVTIGGVPHEVKAGEIIRMPGAVPHAVSAPENFKMLLTMFKAVRE